MCMPSSVLQQQKSCTLHADWCWHAHICNKSMSRGALEIQEAAHLDGTTEADLHMRRTVNGGLPDAFNGRLLPAVMHKAAAALCADNPKVCKRKRHLAITLAEVHVPHAEVAALNEHREVGLGALAQILDVCVTPGDSVASHFQNILTFKCTLARCRCMLVSAQMLRCLR